MLRCELARGIAASRVGLGAVQFGMDYGYTRAFNQAAVDAILEAGIRAGADWVDTAREYGDSEAKIGDFLRRHPKAKLTVCTKLKKLSPEEAAYPARTRRGVKDSAAASLKALGLKSLPVLLLHQTEAAVLENDALWDAVEELKSDGLVESFGASVYGPEEAGKILDRGRRADVFQFPFNVFDRRFAAAAERMRREGIGRIGRSVFLKGLVTAEESKVPVWLSALLPHKRKLGAISRRAGIPEAELALRFALESGSVDAVVLGVSSPEEVSANARLCGRGSLPPAVLEELAAVEGAAPELCDPRRWKENSF